MAQPGPGRTVRIGGLALLGALALLLAACGATNSSASDVQACLEDEGFNVEATDTDPGEGSGQTDGLSYEIEVDGQTQRGRAIFYEDTAGAERRFEISRGSELNASDQLLGVSGNVYFDITTSDANDPLFDTIEGCL